MEKAAGIEAAGARRRDRGARLVVLGVVFAVFGLVVPTRPNLALLAGIVLVVSGSLAIRSGRKRIEQLMRGQQHGNWQQGDRMR